MAEPLPAPPDPVLLVQDDTGPPVVIDRGPAQEEAERELSRELYTQHEPGLFRRIFDWVWDRVLELLDSAVVLVPGGWLGLLLIVAAVLGLLIALRMRLGSTRSARRGGKERIFTEQPRSAAGHRANADEHAAAGRWDQAVQERMRALVRGLEERTLLDPSPGRTADEAATEAARSLPALADGLRAAARTFDAVTYGGRHATAADHHRLRDLDEQTRRSRPDPAYATQGAPR
ncbi:DUF4129 domain-containing protein [Streptomyces sp. ACA25]|uniref:DUF4129 domain-containing protein n=1 Tax=Streptomyces sp. ACA25 TaxID=3022596 RepID=UPI0023082D67|nr:DUF4129 domain-containing protein [Streptomyces sp. ACA25]MDB1089453.1 DUF4129 domain-containing protein [Streptomyces sp. ACA25]